MKKMIIALTLTTVMLGLVACGGTTENQDLQMQTADAGQSIGEVSGDNAVAGNADDGIDQSINYSVHTQNPTSNEILAGTVEAIDGMSITIDTSSVFVAHGTGSHISTGEPPELQVEVIRLTEETNIIVQVNAGGQIAGTRAGTLDDLSLQAIIMAEGEWRDGEFVVTELTIINF